MFLSTIQNKHRYNENEIFCSYNICSKVKLFIPTTITITIESKDQGWSSYPHEHGQRTSCTWGELSLNKLPTWYFLYRNIHAGKTLEEQKIIFDVLSPLVNSP